jgi:hypothetical protein
VLASNLKVEAIRSLHVVVIQETNATRASYKSTCGFAKQVAVAREAVSHSASMHPAWYATTSLPFELIWRLKGYRFCTLRSQCSFLQSLQMESLCSSGGYMRLHDTANRRHSFQLVLLKASCHELVLYVMRCPTPTKSNDYHSLMRARAYIMSQNLGRCTDCPNGACSFILIWSVVRVKQVNTALKNYFMLSLSLYRTLRVSSICIFEHTFLLLRSLWVMARDFSFQEPTLELVTRY